MTVTGTTSRNDYPGTGSTGPFAYTFKIYAYSDLLVTKADANGVETTLVYLTDFTATGAGAAAGGTITLSTALATGETLAIRRVLPLTQLINLRNQGATFPQNVEKGLDQAVMREQQLDNDVQSAVRLAETVDPATFDTRLPANMAAGDAIVVNAAGTGFDMAALTAAQLTAWSATHNMVLDRFTSGVGFTPGVSTTLALSANPGNEDNVTVTARVSGTVRVFEHDEFSVSGTTLTFGSVIPAGATYIEVTYLYTYQVNTAASENVSFAQAASGAVTRNVRARLRETISIYDFGAVGDGSTDDTTAFANAVSYADSVNATVSFPFGTFKITSNQTVPADVTLDFTQGGALSIAVGKTVTINGNVVAQRTSIFTGSGTAVLGAGSCEAAFPEWFGAVRDGVTDDGAAINKALTAYSAAGGTVTLAPGTYALATTVSVPLPMRLMGPGRKKCILKWTGGGSPVVEIGASAIDADIGGFRIENSGTATYGIHILQGYRSVFRDIFCSPQVPFSVAIIATNTADAFEQLVFRDIWFGSEGLLSGGVTQDTPIGLFLPWGNAASIENCWFSGLPCAIKAGVIAGAFPVDGLDISGGGWESFNGTVAGYGGGATAIGLDIEYAVGVKVSGTKMAMAADGLPAGQRAVVIKQGLGVAIIGNDIDGGGVATASISIQNTAAAGIQIAGNAFEHCALPYVLEFTGGASFAAQSIQLGANSLTAGLDMFADTWTPVLKIGGSTVGITYSIQTAVWQRNRRQITVQGSIVLTSKGAAAGAVTITGLPVTAAGTNLTVPAVLEANHIVTGADTQIMGYVGTGTAVLTLMTKDNAGGAIAVLDNTMIANNTEINFAVTYEGPAI